MTDIVERSPAHHALMNYQQADIDGIVVVVSRQAIHEVSDEIERLRAENARLQGMEWLSDELLEAMFGMISRHYGRSFPDGPDGLISWSDWARNNFQTAARAATTEGQSSD